MVLTAEGGIGTKKAKSKKEKSNFLVFLDQENTPNTSAAPAPQPKWGGIGVRKERNKENTRKAKAFKVAHDAPPASVHNDTFC